MKYFSLALMGLTLVCSCQKDHALDPEGYEKGPGASSKIDVHILAGQSNAVGQGPVSDLHAKFRGPLSGCYIYDMDADTVYQIEAGVNNDAEYCTTTIPCHGIEMSYLARIRSATGKDVGMVKHAFDGVPIFQTTTTSDPDVWRRPDWQNFCSVPVQPTWNVNVNGQLYDELVSKCLSAKAFWQSHNRHVTFKSLVWFQGESDSQYPQRAAAWEQNMRDLFAQLKLDLNSPDMNLIIIKIGSFYTGYPHLGTVRASQEVIGNEPGNAIVSCDGCLPAGQIHLSSGCYKTVGTDAANAYLALQ